MNYNHFKNYAIKYYLRFYPSKNRLSEKLVSKFKITENIAKKLVLELEEEWIILEEKVIDEKIKYLISKWKNVNYIKINLIKKQFNKNIIINKLNKISENSSILDKNFVINKILNYKEKHKSKNYIKQKLIERREDKILINNLLEEYYNKEEELENLKINFNKLKLTNKSDKQILTNLTWKWFIFSDVLNILKI